MGEMALRATLQNSTLARPFFTQCYGIPDLAQAGKEAFRAFPRYVKSLA